jgi:transcriptional regulator with XRE-family HTH domain
MLNSRSRPKQRKKRRMAGKKPTAPPFEEIGERLRLTRDAMRRAQNDFAAGAGIAVNTYNQYERGHFQPRIENAIKLCRAYRLTLDWIYLGDASGLPFDLVNKIRALSEPRR